MGDPLHKSFRVFSAIFSALSVVFTGISAAGAAYPDGLPYAEFKPLAQGAGLAGAGMCGVIAGGLAGISKAKEPSNAG